MACGYSPEDVLATISEDPPIFSSIWPRIQNEKLMTNNFRVAVDTLGKPGKRDVEGYLSQVGVPVKGKAELLKIPPFIIKAMFFLARINRAVRPNSPYDTPFLPFNMRAGYKFLSEYDADFSRATIDGNLSKDFSPEEALKRVQYSHAAAAEIHRRNHKIRRSSQGGEQNPLKGKRESVSRTFTPGGAASFRRPEMFHVKHVNILLLQPGRYSAPLVRAHSSTASSTISR